MISNRAIAADLRSSPEAAFQEMTATLPATGLQANYSVKGGSRAHCPDSAWSARGIGSVRRSARWVLSEP